MTLKKSCTKKTVKRGVKFHAVRPPLKEAKQLPEDSDLQSSDKQRRYMRRGSKTPGMLLILKSFDLESQASACEEMLTLSRQQRRLSLLSAIKMDLEKCSIIEAVRASDYQVYQTELEKHCTIAQALQK